jgi:hypothetical protein
VTFNVSPSRKNTNLPAVLIALGCILFIGWMVAMYIIGVVVDEQRIDPSTTPIPLMWYGGIAGPAIALCGVWLARKPKR